MKNWSFWTRTDHLSPPPLFSYMIFTRCFEIDHMYIFRFLKMFYKETAEFYCVSFCAGLGSL